MNVTDNFDPEAPYGRHRDGTPMPQEEWAVRQNLEDMVKKCASLIEKLALAQCSGILLPGFDCSNPDCRAFNGTAKEERATCRCCGTPRPINLEKTMLENLTSVQARCTELLLENRELKLQRDVARGEINMLLSAAAAHRPTSGQ
jgi:hypothetical protein